MIATVTITSPDPADLLLEIPGESEEDQAARVADWQARYDHVWTGPIAEGRDAIALWRAATAYLIRHGFDFTVFHAGDQAALTRAVFTLVRRVSVDCPPALAVQTLSGWTVDGEPVTPARLRAIGADPLRFQEPSAAIVKVWTDTGVFRDALPHSS